MKNWIIGLGFAAALVAALCATSCEKYALPKLELDNDTICAPISGGVYEVTLTSNVRWMFDAGAIPSWVYMTPTDGRSDYVDASYKIQVSIDENKTEEARVAVIQCTTLTLSRKLVIEQEGPEVPETPDSPETGD